MVDPVFIGGTAHRQTSWLPEGGVTPRSEPLETTWDRLVPLFTRYGITRIADITWFDRTGIPVFLAVRPLGRVLSYGCGKGVTPLAARVGAVMEALELAVWDGVAPGGVIASEDTLAEQGLAFEPLGLFAQPRHSVLSTRTPVAWTEGYDIVGLRTVLVPSAAVAIHPSGMAEWPGIPWSTNGLASGSTLLEAVLSGLLEVIERDALLVAGPHPRPIELDGLPEGQCQQLVGRMLEAGLVPRIDDVTVDTATPVIRVVLSDTLHHSGVFHGYGSALGTEVAMVRALTEAAQSRSAMLAGVREDVFWSERRVTALLADGRLATVPDVPVHKEVVFEEAFTGSFEGDIGILVSRLRAAGLDRVIVVRHTDDDHPFQVVRVIVPGSLGLSMRGYDSAPGRLRERRAR